MNKILKNVALKFLGNGIRIQQRVRLIKNKRLLTVLNLHRVAADDGSSYKPLDPKLFEELIIFLKKTYTITTFGEMHSLDSLGESSNKSLVIISFDDGYKDFIEVAMPILYRHRVKVNQNLIPECIETGYPPLNVITQDFVGKAPDSLLRRLIIPGFDASSDWGNRAKLGFRISNFLKNKSHEEQCQLQDLIYRQLFNFSEFKYVQMMTVSDVKQCAEFHELGAHSFSHSSMQFESDHYFENDLLRCRAWFHEVLNLPVSIYAFPNGSYRKSQIESALKFGYENVLLVNEGFSSINCKVHNRFSFYADSDRESLYRAVGGMRKI